MYLENTLQADCSCFTDAQEETNEVINVFSNITKQMLQKC